VAWTEFLNLTLVANSGRDARRNLLEQLRGSAEIERASHFTAPAQATRARPGRRHVKALNSRSEPVEHAENAECPLAALPKRTSPPPRSTPLEAENSVVEATNCDTKLIWTQIESPADH